MHPPIIISTTSVPRGYPPSHADDWEFQERLRNDSRRSTESDDYSSSSSSGRGSGTDASSSYTDNTDRTDNDAEAGKANKQRPVMPKQKSKRVKFASPEKKDTKFDNLMKRVASVLDRPRKCLFVVALLI